jgi:predicted metal-dependent hydrolase|tara:strand:+ start:513 stop:707 length:195 start_codon:yes stop_codon:yes gene_type:complete
MAKIKLWEAIESLNKDAKFQYSHDKDDATIELIDTIIWEHGTTPISNADILAEQKRLQDIEDGK